MKRLLKCKMSLKARHRTQVQQQFFRHWKSTSLSNNFGDWKKWYCLRDFSITFERTFVNWTLNFTNNFFFQFLLNKLTITRINLIIHEIYLISTSIFILHKMEVSHSSYDTKKWFSYFGFINVALAIYNYWLGLKLQSLN